MEFLNYLLQNPEFMGPITALIIAIPITIYYKKHGGTPYEKKLRKKWEEEQAAKEQAEKTSAAPTAKYMTQAEFEKWKAEQKKGQGGYLDLDALAALFKRRAA